MVEESVHINRGALFSTWPVDASSFLPCLLRFATAIFIFSWENKEELTLCCWVSLLLCMSINMKPNFSVLVSKSSPKNPSSRTNGLLSKGMWKLVWSMRGWYPESLCGWTNTWQSSDSSDSLVSLSPRKDSASQLFSASF